MSAWTLQEAVCFVRFVESIVMAQGFHAAIGGSVLHKGASDKDLDIFLYPRKTSTNTSFQPVIDALTAFGNVIGWTPRDHAELGDDKTVFKTTHFGRRIDFFFVQ